MQIKSKNSNSSEKRVTKYMENDTSGSDKLKITDTVLLDIYQSIGKRPAEYGGALGGVRESGEIAHFYFDDSAQRSGATYSPNADFLNQLFAETWNPNGIDLLGFVHSHPAGIPQPSGGDIVYARRILDHIPEMEKLLLPIVISEADTGKFEFIPFAVVRENGDVRVQKLDLEIIPTDSNVEMPSSNVETFSRFETFRRVRDAYDLAHLKNCRVILIGLGGAANFAEELARAGVGEFVLIDPDIVTETNLATQQVYRRDIGRAKVECVAERIKDINPDAVVIELKNKLDEIDDKGFDELVKEKFKEQEPVETIICGLTDDFYAQARVNRLALHFGIPSICAQVYWQGRGAEITFTHPDVTPACHRCMTSSRYEAYINDNFNNNVTSDGTPIFSTTRLNALKGFVTMALLHHGTKHERWGKLMETNNNRTLIQIRMDPDLSRTLKLDIFDRTFNRADTERVLFDETVWLPQEAECPQNGYATCPDCGGTSNLKNSIGKFEDTRIMKS